MPLVDLSKLRVAVICQGGPTPAINGISKPPKPGGYRDSSADTGFGLIHSVKVVTPVPAPSPTIDADWSFPDTRLGILDAVRTHGANVLWANTTLYTTHPLASLREELAKAGVSFVGQDPRDTERFEDKAYCNGWLASQEGLDGAFPPSWLIGREQRESWRMFSCRRYASRSGVEDPTGCEYDVGLKESHWALPLVTRFNHIGGIAQYNGVVAVSQNSRAISEAEFAADAHYQEAARLCERVGELCKSLAPIRIDARRISESGPFKLFDINMKPNATGPGRPGREIQASLTLIAAEALGWSYPVLLRNMLYTATPVASLRRVDQETETQL